ncbi:unnamed protein product [Malus baccata var. baccata]
MAANMGPTLHSWGNAMLFSQLIASLPTQAEEPALIMFVAVSLLRNIATLCFYLCSGQLITAWWNFLRMGFTGKISSATSLLLGLVTFLFKLLGISLVTFEVTQKDQPAHSCDYDEVHARSPLVSAIDSAGYELVWDATTGSWFTRHRTWGNNVQCLVVIDRLVID